MIDALLCWRGARPAQACDGKRLSPIKIAPEEKTAFKDAVGHVPNAADAERNKLVSRLEASTSTTLEASFINLRRFYCIREGTECAVRLADW